ncbi:uncharacterized protein LOC131162718 [Malania oleifera]|uniref:uncharacterized protein LOC131162718 n=1 Tax=Malania oleifera TaxID=397392 RepID=UPI0025ADCF2F|nr:uncharacterized protein LOC131162718 [Malania oleifera]
MELMEDDPQALIASLVVQPTLYEKIKATQGDDPELAGVTARIQDRQGEEFNISDNGALRFRTRLCVPTEDNIRRTILKEAHRSLYIVHLGNTKMYRDLREYFWRSGIKREIAEFVQQYLTCKQLKAEH